TAASSLAEAVYGRHLYRVLYPYVKKTTKSLTTSKEEELMSTWQSFILAPEGSASTTGGITAVSRIPTSMEVWWIGQGNTVQGAYWYDGGQWGHYELAPAGSALTTGGITAVSRIP